MSGETTAVSGALNMQQALQNRNIQSYANRIQLADMMDDGGASLFDTDLGSLALGYNSSMMGMDGSLFGMSGGLGGFGWGSKLTNLYYNDPEQYYREVQKLNELQTQNNVQMSHVQNSAEFETNSYKDAVNRQIGILQQTIKRNDQTHVMDEYYKLYGTVADLLIREGSIKLPESGNISDLDDATKKRIATRAELLYAQATGGSTITGDLEAYGDNEIVQGLKDGAFGIGFLFNPSGKSYKDNLTEITGVQHKTTGDEVLKWASFGVSATAATALTFKALPMVLGGAKFGTVKLAQSTKKSWLNLFGIGAKTAEAAASTGAIARAATQVAEQAAHSGTAANVVKAAARVARRGR